MLAISDWAVAEKNKVSQANVWARLIEISWPNLSAITRITDNNADITWAGHLWTNRPLHIGSVVEDLHTIPALNIQIGDIDNLIEGLLLDHAIYTKANGIRPVTVSIYLINTGNLSETTPEQAYEFDLEYGTTDSVWADLRLGVPSPFRQRTPDNIITTNQCQYRTFKGIECGLPAANPAASCDRSLATCRTLGNSNRYGAFVGCDDNVER